MLDFNIKGGAVAKKSTKKREPHGGRREGSGKPSYFRGKSSSAEDPMFAVPHPWCVRLTATGAGMGAKEMARLNKERPKDKPEISRNVFLEALIRIFGPRLSFAQIERIQD